MAAVRADALPRVRGVVIVLLAALAVLIHHGAPAITDAPARHSTHSAHSAHIEDATPGSASPSAAAPHGSAPGRTAGFDAPAPAHGDDVCAGPGTQHCSTANVEALELPVPPQSPPVRTAGPCGAGSDAPPAGTVGRAPPDLSVLSQLRI